MIRRLSGNNFSSYDLEAKKQNFTSKLPEEQKNTANSTTITDVPANYFNNSPLKKEDRIDSIKKTLKEDPDIVKKLHQKNINDPKILEIKRALANPESLAKIFDDEEIVKKLANFAKKQGAKSQTTSSQVNFTGNILKHNAFWGGEKKQEKAKNIINDYSLASAVVGGLGSQIPGMDLAAVTLSTSIMVKKLAKLYNIPWTEKLTKLTATASAVGMGASLGGEVIQYIPVAGNIINGTLSFTIGKIIGHVFMTLFEEEKNGKINPDTLNEEVIKKDIINSIKRPFSR